MLKEVRLLSGKSIRSVAASRFRPISKAIIRRRQARQEAALRSSENIKEVVAGSEINIKEVANIKEAVASNSGNIREIATAHDTNIREVVAHHDTNIKEVVARHDTNIKEVVTGQGINIKPVAVKDNAEGKEPIMSNATSLRDNDVNAYMNEESNKHIERQLLSLLIKEVNDEGLKDALIKKLLCSGDSTAINNCLEYLYETKTLGQYEGVLKRAAYEKSMAMKNALISNREKIGSESQEAMQLNVS